MLPQELTYNNTEYTPPEVNFWYDETFQYTITSSEQLDTIRLKSLELGIADKIMFKVGEKELKFNEYSVPETNWSKEFFGEHFNIVGNILRLQTQKRKQANKLLDKFYTQSKTNVGSN